MASFDPPTSGTKLSMGDNGELNVPDDPIIPLIEGDGIGRDIWKASVRVFDAAVEKAYGGSKKIQWYEVYADQKAYDEFESWLPDETVANVAPGTPDREGRPVALRRRGEVDRRLTAPREALLDPVATGDEPVHLDGQLAPGRVRSSMRARSATGTRPAMMIARAPVEASISRSSDANW